VIENQNVQEVYSKIERLVVKTPCVYSPYLSEITKASVYLKLENMQRTGSFKERGVLSFLLHHQGEGLRQVVTASAGNHAQSVALHAASFGITATIFMPIRTANTKVAETERLRGEVRLVGENYDEAYAAAQDFSRSLNIPYLHAYNDRQVIMGQASVALEVCQQVGVPDALFVPVGGGGLIAGMGQFFVNISGSKSPKIIGVEAEDYQSMAQALDKGKMQSSPLKRTIAEGIAVRKVGEHTSGICKNLPLMLTAVSDEQIQSAIILLVEKQKTVAEGAGAASVAALLSDEYRHSFRDKTVVLVVSGGNIDISLLARLTAQELIKSSRLSRMSIVIKDSPGSLSALLQTITRASGNIVDIRHERMFAKIRWNEVFVDVTVETKNELHERMMYFALKSEGYVINPQHSGV